MTHWLGRLSYVPAEHEICETGNKQVVINRTEFNAADMISVLKRTQLSAWQDNNNNNCLNAAAPSLTRQSYSSIQTTQ